MRRHRPPPIVRFTRLGLPDVGRVAPPPSPLAWRARATAVVFYALLFAATAVLLVGLGLVVLP